MTNNIYQAPEAELTLASDENKPQNFASRWARLGASVIDFLVMIPILIFSAYVVLRNADTFTGTGNDVEANSYIFLFLFLLVILLNLLLFLVINGKGLKRNGQTIGKRMCNIKIVNLSGVKATKTAIFIRYAYYFLIPLVPILGPLLSLVGILFVFSPTKRCLHDRVAQTKVVSDYG